MDGQVIIHFGILPGEVLVKLEENQYNHHAMSLIRFMIVLGFGSLLSWLTWIMIVTTIDPLAGGTMALTVFYLSFFLALLGTFTIIGFFARYWWEKETVLFRQIGTAFRQAGWIAGGATIALMLQGARVLNGWTALVLLVLLIVTESFFLAGQSPSRRGEHSPQTS